MHKIRNVHSATEWLNKAGDANSSNDNEEIRLLNSLSKQVKMRLQIEEIIAKALNSPLAGQCKAGIIENGELHIVVPSAIFYSRINNMTPSILRALQDCQIHINSIKIRVIMSRKNKTEPEQHPQRTLSPHARKTLQNLHDKIKDPTKKEILQRMLNK